MPASQPPFFEPQTPPATAPAYTPPPRMPARNSHLAAAAAEFQRAAEPNDVPEPFRKKGACDLSLHASSPGRRQPPPRRSSEATRSLTGIRAGRGRGVPLRAGPPRDMDSHRSWRARYVPYVGAIAGL